MPESKKTGRKKAGRPAERGPVSVVRLSAELAARVDAWALDHAIHRPEAIERLIEFGLKSRDATVATRVSRPGAVAIEALATSQIDQLIDPTTPREERDRRIQRLTEGPPEFVNLRIDLPKRDV
jgi:hypothetical protein